MDLSAKATQQKKFFLLVALLLIVVGFYFLTLVREWRSNRPATSIKPCPSSTR